jgi:hypothetical protein
MSDSGDCNNPSYSIMNISDGIFMEDKKLCLYKDGIKLDIEVDKEFIENGELNVPVVIEKLYDLNEQIKALKRVINEIKQRELNTNDPLNASYN